MAVSLLTPSRPLLLGCVLLALAPPLAVAQSAQALAPVAAPAPASPAPVAAPASAPRAETPSLAEAPLAAGESVTPAPRSTTPAEPDLLGAEAEQESLGWTLVRTLLLLGAVVVSIYLTLNVGLRRLMGLQGVPMGKPSVVSVLERVPLDQRRTLFVLKAGDEYLLVGGGESGLQLLSKLDTTAVERIRAESPQRKSTVVSMTPFLQKLLSRRTGSTPPGA